MPPRGVKSAKRKRQYEHIKESAQKSGQGGRAKEIAARTVNKQRREAGQTKSSSSSGSRKSGSRKGSSTRKASAQKKK